MTNPQNRKETSTICLHCEQTFAYKIYGEGRAKHYNRNQKFCSRECAKLFQTKGWGLDKNGYEVHYRSNGQGKRVYVLRHRQVMEDFLGRKLFTHETVHHRDGNRSNNDLSNLELWSGRHGKGQRVEDKVDFCLSFLQEYPDFLAECGFALARVNQPVLRGSTAELPVGMAMLLMQ